jgi:uncharacterized SAM-binding protein YcdF (DUF218 family)
MSLSALPTALLIPPMNLAPIALLGLVAMTWWPRFGRVVALLAVTGLWVAATPAFSGWLLMTLETGLQRPNLAPVDPARPPMGIVVLSGDASHGEEDGLEARSGIGQLTLERMRAGALLQRRTGLPLLVTGGPLERDSVPIGEQMATSLRTEYGVPVRWIEAASVDTWENAKLSAPLLAADGVNSVYLVTSPWHMRRSIMAFRQFGIVATPAPMYWDRPPNHEIDDFIPHASSWTYTYWAMHEWIGCAYYAYRRWRA